MTHLLFPSSESPFMADNKRTQYERRLNSDHDAVVATYRLK
jgi:hypothetical protein